MHTCKWFEPRFHGLYAVSAIFEVNAHYVSFRLYAHIKRSVPVRDGKFDLRFLLHQRSLLLWLWLSKTLLRNRFCNR